MKNNDEILIASSNEGKIREFKNLFKEHKIFSLTDLKIKDAIEDGHSFFENASLATSLELRHLALLPNEHTACSTCFVQ